MWCRAPAMHNSSQNMLETAASLTVALSRRKQGLSPRERHKINGLPNIPRSVEYSNLKPTYNVGPEYSAVQLVK